MNFRRSRGKSHRNSINIVANLEKWRNYGQRISRKNIEFVDEDYEEDSLKFEELKDWADEFFIRKNSGESDVDQDMEVILTRKQTLILSTLVPDEILLMDEYDTAHPKRFVGVLLMADVSGYTALSERYNNLGKSGTYRLTVTLNTYLGSLIELIYSHGGDIIKFAGDAFLALWKTDKRSFLSHTIHTAIACALIIQHSYGSYETDVKVNLKVKLAISAGNLIFVPIGTGIDMNYIIIGLPVYEAKEAESMCTSGEVILTPTAWGHCYSRNYDYVVNEGGFVTIRTILYDPHEKDVCKPFVGFGAMIRQLNKPLVSIKNVPDNLTESAYSISDILKIKETLNLRKSILLAEENNTGSEIRKFMIRPVLTQIDAHQPLEYLTEMRQVTILFITLKPHECTYPQLITIVNNAYQITCDIVYKAMGCVNKIILFDKDVMILVIFGLRGFKHESEAQAALKCSYSIKKSLSALDGVLEVSIGITTGQVYCGVVGHPLRREFTVIGAIVNKAARFMCGFRNKITCDEVTFIKSKMSTNGFTLLPQVSLKGIPQPGKIYEYTEDIRVKELYNIPMIPPLLNRNEEMKHLEKWLEENNLIKADFDALLIIGESRIGKSRLLEWMARYVKNKDICVCYISLTTIHSATPYLGLSQIMNQILDVKEPIVGFAKEEKIIKMLKCYDEDLCYLNNIIKVRFAYHEGIYAQDEKVREEKAKHIFTKLVMSVTETHVIFLDDLQNLDVHSWEFISILLNTINIFIVLTVTRGKFSSSCNWLYSVFSDNKIKKNILGPLTPVWITPLACQILDVDAVPKDLCNSLKLRCNGMPGLIESFIVHLFSTGAIEIKKIQDNELSDWESEDLQFPDTSILRPMALNIREQTTLDTLINENVSGEKAICVVTKKEELSIDLNLQSLDTLIMIQIDSLTPYQQLLLKIASVIGNVVSRDLLENIMYENNVITTAKAIKRLFSMRVLSCANARYNYNLNKKRRESTRSSLSYNSLCSEVSCECCFDYDAEATHNLPKYAFCKVIKFTSTHSRKTCYELLPINQKRQFHGRIVQYLENNKQKCIDCGGTIMIVQSSMSLQPEIPFSRKITSLERNNEMDIIEDHEEETTDIIPYTLTVEDSTDVSKTRSEPFIKNNLPDIVTKTASNVSESKISRGSISSSKNLPQPILKKSVDTETAFNPNSTKRVTISSFTDRDYYSSEELLDDKIYDKFREVMEASKINDWHNLGIIDSKDTIKNQKHEPYFHVSIEKNVSQINFNRCTCAELNITLHEQLINHAIEAELKMKAVNFMIKYSYFSILSSNFENALSMLDKAENFCNKDKSGNIEEFDRKLFIGRIYSLKAASYLMTDNLHAAKLNIEYALRIYRIEFHSVRDFLSLNNILFGYTIKRKKYRIFKKIMKSYSIFCLNIAGLIYTAIGEESKSKTAIQRALNLVQKVDCNVIDICDAYSNSIQLEMDRSSPATTIEIERIANTHLEKFKHPIQADELFALGKLFMAIFRSRMACGNLSATIRSGYKALVISRFLHVDDISLDIIPDLFYILLSRYRIKEAVDVLRLSLQLCSNSSIECETWYYALSIDMILDAGFQLESPNDISRYAEYALHRGKSAGPGRRRLVVGLWTYWLRTNSDRKAKRFESEALSWRSKENYDGTLTTLFSAMRLAEGMLESLARKVDDLKKVVDLMELRSLADKELSKLEKDAHVLRAVYPRWLLLKANSLYLSGRKAVALSTFNQAIDEARRVNNSMEESLACAATLNSVAWIESAFKGQFPNSTSAVELDKTTWHQLMYNMTTIRK